MSAIHSAVQVKLAEAEALVDYYSIRHDLEIAAQLCQHAIDLDAVSGRDSILTEGIVTGAIIRYCRCFAGGLRLGLHRKDIEDLRPLLLTAHDYFKALRDKFVAHPVNPFEEHWVSASVTERDGVIEPITHIGHGSNRMLLSAETAKSLRQLTDGVLEIIEEKIKPEEQKVLEVIKNHDPKFIHSAGLHTPARFTHADVNRQRKQNRKQK